MTQNIYDRPEFFEGYSGLQRSVEGLAGAPEWPALQAMLPPVRGLRVVDLGCGFGWFCRWAAENGARDVLGLDVSDRMLAKARTDNAHPAIRYERADLETLDLPPCRFDLAYSSLALHYVEDLGRLLGAVHAGLESGGRFVFSIEHPVYMAPRSPGWETSRDGRRMWPVDSYFIEGPRRTDWFTKGVLKHHRTMGTTLGLLLDCGFTLLRVEEFCPTQGQIAARPELAEERERPMFLLVSAGR
jgi:SAM-dependent methyltransferase